MNKQGTMRTRNTNKTRQTPPAKKGSKTPVKAEVPETKAAESEELQDEVKVEAVNGEEKKLDTKGSAKKQKKGPLSKTAEAGNDLQEDDNKSTEIIEIKEHSVYSKEEPEAKADAENVLPKDEEMHEAEEEGDQELEDGRAEQEGIEVDEIGDEGEEEDVGEEDNEGDEDDEDIGDDDDADELEEAYVAEEHPELQEAQPVTDRQNRKKLEVFVGGLDKEATQDDIKKAFEGVGEVVEVRITKDTQTGKNKGYAFVRFATVEQATKVATEFKKTQIKGKSCAVVPNEDNDALFLGNINKSWKREQLLEKLKEYGVGGIEELTLMEDNKDEGMNRGYAFLEVATHEDAIKALKLLAKPGTVFGSDKPARVAWARQSEPHEAMMAQVKSVFIDGILPSWTEEKMKELFGKYGEVERIVLGRNMPRSRRNDFAFVNFVARDAAVMCIDFLKDNELVDGETKLKVKARLVKPLPKVRGGKRGSRIGYVPSRIARTGRGQGGVSRGSIPRKGTRSQRGLVHKGHPVSRGKPANQVFPKFMRRREVDERPRPIERSRFRRPLGGLARPSRIPVRDELRRHEVRRDRAGYPGRLVRDFRERDYVRPNRLPPRGSEYLDTLPTRRESQIRQMVPPPRDDRYVRGTERGYDYVTRDYDEPPSTFRRSYGEHGLGLKRPYSSIDDDPYESGPRGFPRARVGYDLPSPPQFESARSPLGRPGISNTASRIPAPPGPASQSSFGVYDRAAAYGSGVGSSLLYGSGKHGYSSLLAGAGSDYMSSGTELRGSPLYGSRTAGGSGGYGYPGATSSSYY